MHVQNPGSRSLKGTRSAASHRKQAKNADQDKQAINTRASAGSLIGSQILQTITVINHEQATVCRWPQNLVLLVCSPGAPRWQLQHL